MQGCRMRIGRTALRVSKIDLVMPKAFSWPPGPTFSKFYERCRGETHMPFAKCWNTHSISAAFQSGELNVIKLFDLQEKFQKPVLHFFL